jgi:hypothetical protein
MIAYPSGHEPDLWHPNPSQSGYRFGLGNTAPTTSAQLGITAAAPVGLTLA